jgi:hypothetical protein
VNNGSLTFNSVVSTNKFGGTLIDNPAAKLVVAGGGALEIDAAPTLADSSSILVTNGSRLKLNVQSGAATVGTGVTATVSSSATLELAGTVSALSSGSNRVNITNSSNAAAEIGFSGDYFVCRNFSVSSFASAAAASEASSLTASPSRFS